MFLRPLILLISLLMALFSGGEASCAEERKPTEYEVKAAYIYNFAKFIDAPSGKAQDAGAAMNVCVIGDDPFGPALAAIEGKGVGGRKIRIRRDLSPQQVRSCDMLFIGSSEKDRLERLVQAVSGLGILTIGDTEGFARQGVMVNFYMENKKVRFEINPKAAGRAGLKISSNLLRIARIVGEP